MTTSWVCPVSQTGSTLWSCLCLRFCHVQPLRMRELRKCGGTCRQISKGVLVDQRTSLQQRCVHGSAQRPLPQAPTLPPSLPFLTAVSASVYLLMEHYQWPETPLGAPLEGRHPQSCSHTSYWLNTEFNRHGCQSSWSKVAIPHTLTPL